MNIKSERSLEKGVDRMVYVEFSEMTKEELQVKLDQYLEEYHPLGYGTSYTTPELVGNKWVAKVSRGSSCD